MIFGIWENIHATTKCCQSQNVWVILGKNPLISQNWRHRQFYSKSSKARKIPPDWSRVPGQIKIFTQLNEDHRSSFFFRKSPTPPASTALCVYRCFCCVGSEGAVDLVTSIWKNGMMYCLKFFNLILDAFPIPNYQVQQVRVGEGFEKKTFFCLESQ